LGCRKNPRSSSEKIELLLIAMLYSILFLP